MPTALGADHHGDGRDGVEDRVRGLNAGAGLTSERIGYRLILREPAWFEHRPLNRDWPRANLHVFTHSCDQGAEMSSSRATIAGAQPRPPVVVTRAPA